MNPMTTPSIRDRADEAAEFLRSKIGETPSIAIVLGSGLGVLAERAESPIVIPYRDIPHHPEPAVAGHAGQWIVGSLGGVRATILQGRCHYYEGHDMETSTFSIRVLQRLGANTLILSASTGGIAPGLRAGDLVLITDHLNLLGANPLRGPNDPELGPRFPDMSEVYSRRLRSLALSQAQILGIELKQGVYAAMTGPSYETPAEIRMLRTLGADVVGMSTVHEAIVARHGGMEVLAFAVVANAAAGLSDQPIEHSEVVAVGNAAGQKLGDLIASLLG